MKGTYDPAGVSSELNVEAAGKVRLDDLGIFAANGAVTQTVPHNQSFGTSLKKLPEARNGSIDVVHADTGTLLGSMSQIKFTCSHAALCVDIQMTASQPAHRRCIETNPVEGVRRHRGV